MPQFSLERFIDAPCDVVFDAATDLHSAAENIRGIQKMEVLTEGPVGVGTRFRETRIMFKKEATEVMEISVFDRPSRYVHLAESHGTKYLTTYELTPEGSGTRLVRSFQAAPQTFSAKVLSLVFALFMKACIKAIEKDMDDLKTLCESS